MLNVDPSQAQESMPRAKLFSSTIADANASADAKPLCTSATGAKPSGSIQLLGKFLEGHNSGEQVPKRSKGERFKVNTTVWDF